MAAALALSIVGLRGGAASALAVAGVRGGAARGLVEVTGVLSLLPGLPANSAVVASLDGVAYAVANDGLLYACVNGRMALVPGAPRFVQNAVEAGGALYLLSGPDGAPKTVSVLKDGAFHPVASFDAAGPMVAFGGALYFALHFAGQVCLGTATGDSFSILSQAPRGVQALAEVQGTLYLATPQGDFTSTDGATFSAVPVDRMGVGTF